MCASWVCPPLGAILPKNWVCASSDSHRSLWTVCYMDGLLRLRLSKYMPRCILLALCTLSELQGIGMMTHLFYSSYVSSFSHIINMYTLSMVCLFCWHAAWNNTTFLLWIVYVLRHIHIMSCNFTPVWILALQSRGLSSWAFSWPSSVGCALLTIYYRISVLQRH